MIKVYKNFLTQVECSQILKYVLENKDDWDNYPDTKLGATSSISVYGNSYFRHLLKNNFNTTRALQDYNNHRNLDNPWMYNLLLERFNQLFECKYTETLAKPAFQIINDTTPRVWHYDDEKTKYNYKTEFPESTGIEYFDSVYTMTIMISSGNFTYNYYPETLSRYTSIPKYYCNKHHGLVGDICDCDLHNYQTINYSVGDLILTKDRYLHRVGASSYTNDINRITLQGHIVSKKDIHYLYW